MEPPALLSADHDFRFEKIPVELRNRTVSWNSNWSGSSWSSSSAKKHGSSGWNNRDWQRGSSKPPSSSPPSQSSVPNRTVSLPSSFAPDWDFCDSNSAPNNQVAEHQCGAEPWLNIIFISMEEQRHLQETYLIISTRPAEYDRNRSIRLPEHPYDFKSRRLLELVSGVSAVHVMSWIPLPCTVVKPTE